MVSGLEILNSILMCFFNAALRMKMYIGLNTCTQLIG